MPFWIAGDGFQVVGFELDPSCGACWSAAGVPCRPDPSKTKFESGDMLNLPLANATIDIACSVSAIKHTSDPIRAVAEMLRVVKPRGGLILTMNVDIRGSDSVSWKAFSEIVSLLEYNTRPSLPVRQVTPESLLTFENRTLDPQSRSMLLSKRVLDYLGIRARTDQTVFAWAGERT